MPNMKDTYILHREVLFEKVLDIVINPKHMYDVNCAWYMDRKYTDVVFKVRNNTKREYVDMINNKMYGPQFKSRCSKKMFYVIVSDRCKEMFIGKCDSIIIKNEKW